MSVPLVPDELRYRVTQRRLDDPMQVESLIACFQHRQPALQFVSDYRAITGHYLHLKDTQP